MPDQIRAAVAIQRPLIEGVGPQGALHKLIARYASSALYRRPGPTIDRLRREILREVALRWLPEADRIGLQSARPVLGRLGGERLLAKASRPRGQYLARLRRYRGDNLRVFAADLRGACDGLSAEVEAAFMRARRDGVARKQLIEDLTKSHKAEMKRLREVRAEIRGAAKDLQGAEGRLAKASKRTRRRARRQMREAREGLRKAKAKVARTKDWYGRFETAVQGRARDAIRRECQEAQFSAFQQAGYKTFTWIAVNGTGACPSCTSLHGKTQPQSQWRGAGPGEADTYCGSACMCQLVPQEYTKGNEGLARPIQVS